MTSDRNLWFESIPTYLGQNPRTLDSFKNGEKYEDDFFPPIPSSLIDQTEYQNIQDDYNLEEKNIADKLNSITIWKRISELYPEYDLFPPELHCDCFKQGKIGDCYFVDMIALISNYDELLKRLFPIKKNNYGYYEVILFINGWKRVIIDDYIPLLNHNNNLIPLGCESKKYQNCFYNMLIEKAWAKVNRNYYHIFGGSPSSSLLVLTGYRGKDFFFLNNLNDIQKSRILKDMKEGIRTYGYLYGVNTKGHAYSLLDIENYSINNNNYEVLKVRNPWGILGEENVFKANPNLGIQFQNKKAIVEDELMPKFEAFNNSPDTGIFFISKNYFFQLFKSYSKCYHMFNSSVIEFLLKLTSHNLTRKYFMFQLTVKEKSLVQINLTKHHFNNKGKMKFNYYNPQLRMKPFVSNDTNKKIPIGMYFIEWHYDEVDAPEEILFWIYFQGKVELEFLGISQCSQIQHYNNYLQFSFDSNNGLNIEKHNYKLSEKLGETYQRKANIYKFIEDVLHCSINQEEEDRGYSVAYQENDNVNFSFIIDKENSTRIRILSQNLDFPEFIFEGRTARKSRIFGVGNIYSQNALVYHGQINYNLFPQFVQEDNNNRLIIDVEAKRFKLSQEISEELVDINIRRVGPFEGQIVKITHPHALTKCKTLDRKGFICDHCDKRFDTINWSYYCSECDFDFCSHNCERPNRRCVEMTPHFNKNFHVKTFQHKHPLVRAKLFNRNHQYKCFSCLKNIPIEKSIYYCTRCDFRLCQACKINESRGEEWQFHCSWHEHPLTFCKTRGYKKNKYNKNDDGVEILEDSEFYFTCNHCGVEYSLKKDSFYCTACNFHICMKCYKNYFFYNEREVENAVNVLMGNSEVYPVYCRCFLNNENIEQVNCKKCNALLNLDEWTYYCSNCNSNFCINCYRSHKVIFNNNILIYDGFFENNRKQGFGITYKINNAINYSGNWENGIFKLMKDFLHSHPLIRNYFNDNIKCDKCLKMCDSSDTGLSCRRCNLNICDRCIIKINSKYENITIEKDSRTGKLILIKNRLNT